MRRPFSPTPVVVTALLAVGTLFGCGGEAEPPGPVTPVQRRPAPPPVAVAAGTEPKADPDSQPGTGEPIRPSVPLPEDADPADVFVIGEANAPGGELFDLLPARASASQDEFVLGPAPAAAPGAALDLGSPPPAGGTPKPGLTWPSSFEPLPEFGWDEQGFPRRLRCTTDDSVMVLVPGGPFRMGSSEGPANTRPELMVTLDPYYIDRTEVTVSQFLAYRETLSAVERGRAGHPANEATEHPAEPAHGLRFADALSYAQWCGKDLPTEAEWEKAARGTDGRFPWGRGRAAFSRGRTATDIAPVMSFPQDKSPYGAWDMAGNAREWCRDWYADDAHQRAVDRGDALENWTGPSSAGADYLRVVKGNGPDWSAWHRTGVPGTKPGEGVGFRGVLRYRAGK